MTFFKINKPISRILYLFAKALIIYLRLLSPITFIDLPSDIGRAALHTSVYLVFQLVRFTLPTTITCSAVKLLPRLFTLTSYKAVFFCGTFCLAKLWLCKPSRQEVRCPMLFGLSSLSNTLFLQTVIKNSDKTACSVQS